MKVRYGKVTSVVTVLVALLFVLSIGVVSADGDDDDDYPATYRVTVQNLTGGQPFSPVIAATHQKKMRIFKVGKQASPELEILAENGDNGPLFDRLNGSGKVTAIFQDGGLLMPGASVSFDITANRKDRLSLAGMLVCTNDAFAGLNRAKLPKDDDHPRTYYVKAYDAGTEMNTEAASDVPCLGGGENDAVDTNEKISRHPGIQGGGDLDPAVRGWDGPVAKVIIERIDD